MKNQHFIQSVSIAFLTATSLSLNFSAYAQSSIGVGTIGYGGNGCPQGSLHQGSGTAGSLVYISDEFVLEAGGANGKMIERKSCSVSIPLAVPQGYSVSLNSHSVKGFASLVRGSSASLRAETFFSGSRGPISRRNFFGPLDNLIELDSTLAGPALIWSPCGQNVIIRVNIVATLQTSARNEPALLTVSEISGETLAKPFSWRRCH